MGESPRGESPRGESPTRESPRVERGLSKGADAGTTGWAARTTRSARRFEGAREWARQRDHRRGGRPPTGARALARPTARRPRAATRHRASTGPRALRSPHRRAPEGTPAKPPQRASSAFHRAFSPAQRMCARVPPESLGLEAAAWPSWTTATSSCRSTLACDSRGARNPTYALERKHLSTRRPMRHCCPPKRELFRPRFRGGCQESRRVDTQAKSPEVMPPQATPHEATLREEAPPEETLREEASCEETLPEETQHCQQWATLHWGSADRRRHLRHAAPRLAVPLHAALRVC